MRYDRKIKYLDYLENGERVRGSGFLKTEIFEDSFKIEVTVRGVRGAKEFNGDVIICGNGREEVLGKIQIEDGQGEFRHACHVNAETGSTIGGTEIGFEELTGVKIPLGEGREIACMWDASNSAVRSSAEPSLKPVAKPLAEPSSGLAARSLAEPLSEPSARSLAEPLSGPAARSLAEPLSGPAARSLAEPLSGPAAKPQADQPVKPAAKQQEKVRKKAAREYIPHPKQTVSRKEVKVPELQGTEETRQERPAPRKEVKVPKLQGTEEKRQERSVSRKEVKVPELRGTEETRQERPAPRMEVNAQELRKTEEKQQDRKVQEEQTEAVPLLENKWLQLCAIYPHIKPFRDQREYLSIGPEDFVLFSSDSYKAASNSFMLHGYYNYRHLILTREERRGEIVYYVGVPGNYYDREKQVAIMFGFESFECAQEPAQSSDFGYYMMKVRL